MQCFTPCVSLVCLMISVTQEDKMGMITKDYVTLAFVLSIDNLFAKTLPEEVRKNVGIVNASGQLRMGKDYNTT